MADNPTVDNGDLTDFTVSADECTSGMVQRVKLAYSADGIDTLVQADAQGVLVQLGNNNIVPGTGSSNLGKAEDGAHGSGDVGVMALAVRRSDANGLSPMAGADDDYIPLAVDNRGALIVVPRRYSSRIRTQSAGLTTASTAYSVGDQVGTLLSIASAARLTGGTGVIRQVVLLDKADVITDMRIHFFRASVTLASDNAAFSVSDTDMESYIGMVTLASAVDLGGNRIAQTSADFTGIGFDCSGGTTLYAALETRTANTFFTAVTDLHLITHITQD